MKEFKNWHEIMEWADRNGYEKMARRMNINNSCWNTSGDFGRLQVAICDAMRYAQSEAYRHETAQDIERKLENDIMLDLA